MKKLWLIPVLALLLWGCSRKGSTDLSSVPTGETTLEQTEPTELTTVPTEPPPALYEADSLLEQESGGAVRVYPIDGEVRHYSAYRQLLGQPGGVLLLSDEGELSEFFGEDCVIGTTDTVACLLRDSSGALYDYEEAFGILTELDTGKQWTLPEGVAGQPLVSSVNREIYYCVGGQIRALHMDTGLPRLVQEHSFQSWSLMGLYFEDTVLGLRTESGARLLYTKNGQTVYDGSALAWLVTEGTRYGALLQGEDETEVLFGESEGTVMELLVTAPHYTALLSQSSMMTWSATESGLTLRVYDLQTGLCVAETALSGVSEILDVMAHEGYIWILGEGTLYRWDTALSPVEDETVYISQRYTAASPDAQGLSDCQSRVDTMNSTYGLRIRIWENALEQTGGYTVEAEYRVPELEARLDGLEAMLTLFPEGFLAKTVPTGWVYVNLVRSIEGDVPFVQYWADGDCYVTVAASADPEEAFYTGLGWGIDSKILGNSRDLEYWNDLNPGGFRYDGDYALSAAREDAQYLEGDSRYFADKRSMAFPTEDRARIFYYAMTAGNGELFRAPVLQKKLKLVCDGIREAYGLKNYADPLPWEQYLT